MFEDALTQLPWETLDDIKQLIELGAKIKKEKVMVLMEKAIRSNDTKALQYIIDMTGGVKTLREMDSVYTPGKNEFDLLNLAVREEGVKLPILKTLVENKFNIRAGTSPQLHRFAYTRPDKRESEFPNWGLHTYESEEKRDYLKSKGYETFAFLSPNSEKNDEVWKCIRKNDVKGLTELMKKGYNPNFMVDCNDGYFSPMAEAMICDEPEIAEVLLTYGGMVRSSGYDDDDKLYTMREYADRLTSFENNPEKRKRWERLMKKEELLRIKFPARTVEYSWVEDKKEGEPETKARRTTLRNILTARAAGQRGKANEIAEEFHKKNPKQPTALLNSGKRKVEKE